MMDPSDLEHIAARARETQKAIRGLGVKRTPSGVLKPTPAQAAEGQRLKEEWWAQMSPLIGARWEELDQTHQEEMAKNDHARRNPSQREDLLAPETEPAP